MALKRLEVYQTELQTLVNANTLFTMGLNGWRWTEAKKKGRYCRFSCKSLLKHFISIRINILMTKKTRNTLEYKINFD